MATYGKIRDDGSIMNMPNPITLKYSNPNETQKAKIADLDGWLEEVTTPQPEYDPETQYLTQYWVAEVVEGKTKAVQHWEIHDNPPEPETEE